MPELLNSTDLNLDKQSLQQDVNNFDDDRNIWSDAKEAVDHATQLAGNAEKKIATQLTKLWYDPKTFGTLGHSLDGRVAGLSQAWNSLEQTIGELNEEVQKLNDPETKSIFEEEWRMRGYTNLNEWEILQIITTKIDEAINHPDTWLITQINSIIGEKEEEENELLWWDSTQQQQRKQQLDQEEQHAKDRTERIQAQESEAVLHASLDLSWLNTSLDTPLSNTELQQFGEIVQSRMQELESFFINTNATKSSAETMSKNYTSPDTLMDIEYIDAQWETQDIPFLTKDMLGDKLFTQFTWWLQKRDSQETQLLTRAQPHINQLRDKITTQRQDTSNRENSNLTPQTQIQTEKKNIITGETINEAASETLDIIRPEEWMKDTMEQRTQSEITSIIQTLKDTDQQPWSHHPFHNARWGSHVLEFDTTWSMTDINVFDFDNTNNDALKALDQQQKDHLETLLENSGNNDKLIIRMNEQFDIARTKAAREGIDTQGETWNSSLETYTQKDLWALLGERWNNNGIIQWLITDMQDTYHQESGILGDIDQNDKMRMRKNEFLITKLLDHCHDNIKNIENWEEQFGKTQQYHELRSAFNAIMSWIGSEKVQDADTAEMALASWESSRRIDYAIQNIESELYRTSPTEMVNLYRDKMISIAVNSSQTDSFKESAQYMQALGKRIGEKIKENITDPQQGTEKDTNVSQLFRLLQIMRDSWSGSEEVNNKITTQLNKNIEESDKKEHTTGIHNDFKDLNTAKEYMHWLMTEWWQAEVIAQEHIPEGKWQKERNESAQRWEDILHLIGFDNETFPDEKTQKVLLQNILWQWYEQVLSTPYEELSLQHRALLDGLHTISERNLSLEDMIKAHWPKKWPAQFMQLISSIMNESRSSMMKTFAESLWDSDNSHTDEVHKEMYDALIDMHGTGRLLDASDEQYAKNLQYADMAWGMVVALATTALAIKTLWAWSWVAAAAWSQFVSSLAWSAAGLAYEIWRGRWFESVGDFAIEGLSTIGMDAWVTFLTLGLGKWLWAWFARFGQWTKNILRGGSKSQKILTQAQTLSKGGSKTSQYWSWAAETGRDMGMEMPLWLYAEQQKQKILHWQDVSLESMISEMWPLMGIMAAWKIQELTGIRTSFPNLEARKQQLVQEIDTQIEMTKKALEREQAVHDGQMEWSPLVDELTALESAKKKLIETKETARNNNNSKAEERANDMVDNIPEEKLPWLLKDMNDAHHDIDTAINENNPKKAQSILKKLVTTFEDYGLTGWVNYILGALTDTSATHAVFGGDTISALKTLWSILWSSATLVTKKIKQKKRTKNKIWPPSHNISAMDETRPLSQTELDAEIADIKKKIKEKMETLGDTWSESNARAVIESGKNALAYLPTILQYVQDGNTLTSREQKLCMEWWKNIGVIVTKMGYAKLMWPLLVVPWGAAMSAKLLQNIPAVHKVLSFGIEQNKAELTIRTWPQRIQKREAQKQIEYDKLKQHGPDSPVWQLAQERITERDVKIARQQQKISEAKEIRAWKSESESKNVTDTRKETWQSPDMNTKQKETWKSAETHEQSFINDLLSDKKPWDPDYEPLSLKPWEWYDKANETKIISHNLQKSLENDNTSMPIIMDKKTGKPRVEYDLPEPLNTLSPDDINTLFDNRQMIAEQLKNKNINNITDPTTQQQEISDLCATIGVTLPTKNSDGTDISFSLSDLNDLINIKKNLWETRKTWNKTMLDIFTKVKLPKIINKGRPSFLKFPWDIDLAVDFREADGSINTDKVTDLLHEIANNKDITINSIEQKFTKNGWQLPLDDLQGITKEDLITFLQQPSQQTYGDMTWASNLDVITKLIDNNHFRVDMIVTDPNTKIGVPVEFFSETKTPHGETSRSGLFDILWWTDFDNVSTKVDLWDGSMMNFCNAEWYLKYDKALIFKDGIKNINTNDVAKMKFAKRVTDLATVVDSYISYNPKVVAEANKKGINKEQLFDKIFDRLLADIAHENHADKDVRNLISDIRRYTKDHKKPNQTTSQKETRTGAIDKWNTTMEPIKKQRKQQIEGWWTKEELQTSLDELEKTIGKYNLSSPEHLAHYVDYRQTKDQIQNALNKHKKMEMDLDQDHAGERLLKTTGLIARLMKRDKWPPPINTRNKLQCLASPSYQQNIILKSMDHKPEKMLDNLQQMRQWLDTPEAQWMPNLATMKKNMNALTHDFEQCVQATQRISQVRESFASNDDKVISSSLEKLHTIIKQNTNNPQVLETMWTSLRKTISQRTPQEQRLRKELTATSDNTVIRMINEWLRDAA